MDKQLSVAVAIPKKRRMTTVASPFFVTLCLSTASAFSIQSHHTHPIHRPLEHQHSAGTSLGFSKASPLPVGGVTGTHIDDADSNNRRGRGRPTYFKQDVDVFRSGNLGADDDDEKVDAPTSHTKLPVSETHRRQQSSMEHASGGLEKPRTSVSAFALERDSLVPKEVTASVFSSKKNPSPLVLTPSRLYAASSTASSPSNAESLRSFLTTHQKWVEECVLSYGGIIFRDFGDVGGVGTVAIGKEILRALGSSKSSTPPSQARRGFRFYLVSGDKSVVPVGDRIGFSSPPGGSFPKRISELSARAGLTDWRRIYDDLPTNLRQKLNEKHLLYTRTNLPIGSTERPQAIDDIHNMFEDELSSWFQLFGSTNKRVFAKAYRQIMEPIEVHPTKETFVAEAFRRHPQTDEKIWFEFAHRLHWTSLPAEFLAEFKRSKYPLALVNAVKEASVGLWRQLRGGRRRNSNSKNKNNKYNNNYRNELDRSATTVSFGDGTPISWWEMHQIRRAIRDNTARYAWKQGDFVVVDGLSMGLQ